jgi:ppGpp synthetase/RelA/SpoT-type nucleotidyltranferase
MKIAEYEAGGKDLYERLAVAVETVLREATEGLADVRVQQVQHRSKGLVSLRKKMADRGVADGAELEQFIKDLAGCRVILYTNADVERLRRSPVFRANFEVDWDRTKIHYPYNEGDPEQLFVSYNYVLKLNEHHLAQAGRGELRDMYCEVQVQTILDHAWSEMAHDTIYKPPNKGFGTRQMDGVRKRMTEIMNKYLLPAGFDFQKVAEDVAKLRAAQELHDRDPLKLLVAAGNNRERLELLHAFEDLVLPHYDDRGVVAPYIRATMMTVASAARTSGPDPQAEEDEYHYANADAVIDKVCEILDALRFLDDESVVSTFDCLHQLYRDADTDEQRQKVMASGARLAEHNIHIWEARGPLVQRLLMERIETIPELGVAEPFIVQTLEKILQPEVTGTTSSFDAVTFHQGSVVASADLDSVRTAATTTLERLFLRAEVDSKRASLIQALHAGTRLASLGKTTAEFYASILKSAARFVRFFTEQWPSLAFELRQIVENRVLWLYRHRNLPEDFEETGETVDAFAALQDAMALFRATTDEDSDYVVFKTLVGFDEVLAPYWDGDPFDKSFRDEEVDRLVREIDVPSLERWRILIERCAASQSRDGAYFTYFSKLLRGLARHQPDLAISLLEPPINHLDGFLEDLLQGFEAGPRDGDVMRSVDRWIDEGRYLSAIARYLWRPQRLDPDLLRRTLDASLRSGDRQAISLCLRSGGEHVLDHPNLLHAVMLPAISALANADAPRWVASLAFSKGGLKSLAALSKPDAKLILDALVQSPTISHWAEEVLARIVPRHAEAFVEFIAKRIEAGETEPREHGYEAIPFEFHVLPEHMAPLAVRIVSAARMWFEAGGALFRFRGGAAVARLFPRTADIEPALKRYVTVGGRDDIAFVVNVLLAYFDGASATLSVCRDVVEKLPPDDDLLSEVGIVIEQSGMLTGDFGGVDATQAKRDYMQTWLSDPRPRVRQFAAVEIRDLERSMAADQRRSMEQLQLRKRNWGAA